MSNAQRLNRQTFAILSIEPLTMNDIADAAEALLPELLRLLNEDRLLNADALRMEPLVRDLQQAVEDCATAYDVGETGEPTLRWQSLLRRTEARQMPIALPPEPIAQAA